MSLLGLILLMALVLAVMGIITFMSRLVTAAERIEALLERLVDAPADQAGEELGRGRAQG